MKCEGEGVQDGDPMVPLLYSDTEEGQKVSRNAGPKFLAVFQRVPDPFPLL